MPAFARLGVRIVTTGCLVDLSKIVWEARHEPALDMRETVYVSEHLKNYPVRYAKKVI